MTDEQKEPINNKALAELRDKIDEVDRQIVQLLNTRAKLVVDVGKLKRGKDIPIYAPHREQAVLKRVLELNEGPLPARTIEAIYRETMSGSFFLEQPLRIGYLGPEGSFCHVAAMRHFGSSVEFENLHSAEGAFVEVARGHVDYALAPIESTTGGGITETLDAFTRYHDAVHIYGELQLQVHRCLLSNAQPHEIEQIFATPEVFSYCRKWLAVQFPNAAQRATATTADAVEQALKAAEEDDAHVAAIGSAMAGEIHGLHVLFPDIEDEPNAVTRFLILSKQRALPSSDDKTSIMFTTADKPGALVAVLSVFDQAGVNLTHIDKRPSGRTNWDYTFFIDAQGHRDDPKLASVIEEARSHCKELTELGSYPASQRVL